MNYAIRKSHGDQRHNTFGFYVPDNHVCIVESKFGDEVSDRLKGVQSFGYVVDETSLPVGLITEADYFKAAGQDVPDADEPEPIKPKFAPAAAKTNPKPKVSTGVK